MASRLVSARDAAWLLFFSALAAVSPTLSDPAVENAAEVQLLVALAVVQVLEPRLPFLQARGGYLFSIVLKLLLGFLLIGVTGGVQSSYYLILLVPVVSAATSLGAWGTVLVTLAACGAYVSFLLFLDWQYVTLLPADVRELALRVLFLCIISFLTYHLVEANRSQARKYQNVAEQLAEANANLRQAEAEVRRSERLAALGQLTAGLAHELRNPLGTMRASAEVLRQNVAAENAVARELADYIASEVVRTSNLITKFLDFARPLRLSLRTAELSEVIDRAVAQLENHQPPFDVSVYKNYSPDIKPFPMDGDLIESVMYNLLENAAQATPGGGAVTVKTRPLAGGVEISVIDRGAGIKPEDKESIFNPFFTTKSNGIGLGLALVARIVGEHGGKIAADSEPGQGSVFRVVLPVEHES